MKSKQEIKSFQLILINESCLHFFQSDVKTDRKMTGESFRILSNPYCQILIKTGLFEYKVCYCKQFSQYICRPGIEPIGKVVCCPVME